jgi:hypothetical protein
MKEICVRQDLRSRAALSVGERSRWLRRAHDAAGSEQISGRSTSMRGASGSAGRNAYNAKNSDERRVCAVVETRKLLSAARPAAT